GPAVSEGGQRSPSPQHARGPSQGSPHQTPSLAHCAARRPSDENNVTPAEICQWTNPRVMDVLRSVDLAEYAP
ncbi:unnamed protein product, partial [Tetraodon nigroviridis]